MHIESQQAVLVRTRAWVDNAVIGLNLCPFAKAVQVKNLVRYVVTNAVDTDSLLTVLCEELQMLANTPSEDIETTLLIHPQVLTDFLDYNDFLEIADIAIEELNYGGIFQVASFHPQYQFAGTAIDELSNASNHSPYPTLHLLRESSVDRAVAAYPEAEAIYETNILTLEKLGIEGWNRILEQYLPAAEK
jgi:hypothetical protein